MNKKLRKIAVFGAVGIGASLIHLGVAAALNATTTLPLVLSGSLGYAAGFVWSYLGHYHFTFQSQRKHTQAILRFALTALLGYLVNTTVVAAGVLTFGFETLWFVTAGIVIAASVVFVVSNLWAMGGKT